MNYLAIDTSGKTLTVVLCKDGKVYSHFDADLKLQHSTTLMPTVERLAKEADFDFTKADFFACVVGAGSFTGIRIGVSTIKALCFAFNKPCLSITSFDTIAYNINGGKVISIIDAKHNGFYVCAYEDFSVKIEPSYVMKDQLLELVKEYKPLSGEKIEGLDTTIVSIKDGLVIATEKKSDQVSFDIESLVPVYVRKSQAEEGR